MYYNWPDFIGSVIGCFICIKFTEWRIKKNYHLIPKPKYSWECITPDCTFSVGSDNKESLKKVIASHRATFH